MNRANRNCERSSAILTIFKGTEVHGPHLHDQGRRSLQKSVQVLATFYIPIQHMILNGIVNGYMSESKSICLCVQIKGEPHIGHLLESNLSRHTVILHINGSFKKLIHMTVIWIRYGDVCITLIHVTQVKYTINCHIII